ncbi:MAG: FAD-dependent oxidoreductase [Candidatus Nanohaloarchaea archaeon]|nr:FAD-dependent oxidoreductase [Candidatus Nanohaloarchaea archaeon]
MSDVVIAGGGIGGLEAALRIERATDRHVTVVEPSDSTLFYPSLHRVLEGADMDAVRIDLGDRFLDRDIDHVRQRMTGMRPDDHVMELEDRDLEYDTAVVAVGSRTSYGSIQGTGNVHDLRFRDDTADIAAQVAADSVDDVVIVGGGATGVEAAASLYAASTGLRDFSITVLEAADSLLPQFDAALGQRVADDYTARGIDVRTGTRVDCIEPDRVILDTGEAVASDLTVWAGGVSPRPVLAELGLEHTARGLPVDRYMRCEGREDVYAIGDAAAYDGKVDRAYYAIAEAKTAAKNIARDLAGKEPVEHSVGRDPNLIYLGPWDALFALDGWTWRGRIPALMRRIGVEQRYLWTRRHLL